MYYILNESVALRSFWLVPYAYYEKNVPYAKGLKKDEFERLILCDGNHDIESDGLTERLLNAKLIASVKKGEKSLSPWQKHRFCDNRYMPTMNLMITGKCNFNCLHCFNAKDNSPLQSEWSFPEMEKLLDDAVICGIHGFTITGGEPMAHPRFFDIIHAIYERNMYVFELNTNGFFIRQDALDKLKEIGSFPLMKISFDGFGYHDWMRNHKGAEEDAIRAIKLCLENGFRVKVQMNINRKNKPSILETLKHLNQMGVDRIRMICTTESTRWAENAHGMSFTVKEYYDTCLEVLQEYIKENHHMSVDCWQFLDLDPLSETYTLTPLKGCLDSYRESRPVCQGNRGMIAVGATGAVYPCLQMSGWMEANGMAFGNVKKEGLKKILQNSSYLKEVCTTLSDLRKANEKCSECPSFRYCRGGCRAIGLLTSSGNMLASDPWKCYFFENGYIEKSEDMLSPYRNITKIEKR